MTKSRTLFVGMLVVLAALALVASFAPTQVEAKKKQAHAKGLITAIDTTAGTVTIDDKKTETLVTVSTDEDTKIRKDKNKEATLADLAVGDKAKVRYNSETEIAKRIRAKTPKLKDTITALDPAAQLVTIETKLGTSVTVTITNDTILKKQREAITFADLAIGDRVKGKYDSTTLEASHLKVKHAK